MIRISNISFFRFCWKNGKLDWPKCARTSKPQVFNFATIPDISEQCLLLKASRETFTVRTRR